MVVKFRIKDSFVNSDSTQCSFKGVVRLYRVAESSTDVTKDCAVREVTLIARDGQLHGKVVELSNGHSKVSLRVFKVNRVDLVWHG